MLDKNDFSKKQIVMVFCNNGENLSFKNDNLIVKDENGDTRLQLTCYRIFAVFVIGNTTITSGLIQRAHKFNFAIVLFTVSFRVYEIIGASDRGNTYLRRRQYDYSSIDIPKYIVVNKLLNQQHLLKSDRHKSDYLKNAVIQIEGYKTSLSDADSIRSIMGYEGASSKVYFKAWFNNVLWTGRKPRVKCDITNSLLDIGYTVLFNFIEAVLNIYGFDLYVGVLHREFYMRKSLVCDMVEPFRPIIDKQVKNSINLKQFREEQFLVQNHQYVLKWEFSPMVVSVFLKAIMSYKTDIFLFIQKYYRCFMKDDTIGNYPIFEM